MVMDSDDLEEAERSEEKSDRSRVEHNLEEIIFWEEVAVVMNCWS